MDIFAEAPLALLEVDRLSSDSSNLPGSLRDGMSNGHCRILSSSSDLLDFDILCSGSLSDLILNFDDLVHSPLVSGSKPTKDGSDGERFLQGTTLSDVKFWWKEALDNSCSLQYPLGEPPSKLGSYDDFESADVDGVTEDGELDALRGGSAVPLKSHLSAESMSSYRGQVTTDSDCSSTCVEHDTSGDTDSTALTSGCTCEESVSDLSPGHSKSHSRLLQLPVEGLKHYLDRLTADIMQLSDRLLELLATRDELFMLREASDDFIVLLNLVHQRRSRASRAALIATARTRIRLKGFSRFRFPWSTKNVYTSNACSLSSLREDLVSSVRPANTSGWWKHNRPMPESMNTGDSVVLNSSDCVAAYHKSLNLQSKHRRPRTQPITTGPANVRQPQYTFQNRDSSKDPDPTDHRATNGTDDNATHLNSGPSVSNDRARERLLALKDLCNNLAWPQGRPQLSQFSMEHFSKIQTLFNLLGLTLKPGFSRFRFPWSTKNVYTSNACSLSSLREDLVSSVRPANTSGWWKHNRPMPESMNTGDSVVLNSSDCVAAYHKSLNLQSKHRRPRTQPITTGPANVRQPQYTFQNRDSSKDPDPTDHRATNGTDDNATHLNSGPSVSNARARERLLALKDLCNNLAWPQGRPQLSQSLSLTLPIDVGPGDGVTLAKLRVINRVLHGTLLENPDTVQLIGAYTQAVQRKHDVTKWVNGGANTASDLADPPLKLGIPCT